jgi:hypothetical protein
MANRNLMTTEPTKPPDSASPSSPPRPSRDPVSWLLEAARRVPVMVYAIAVVGLSAAAALSMAFAFGNYLVAVYGAVAVLAGMMIVRLYAVMKPTSGPIDVGLPAKVLIWAGVVAFVVVLAVGVASFSIATIRSISPVVPPVTQTPAVTPAPDKAELPPKPVPSDVDAKVIEGKLANLARERIRLRKRGEPVTAMDYLGVLRLELTARLATAIVVVEPMGDYETPWSFEECESKLESEINRIKADLSDDAVRNLNITRVIVSNTHAPEDSSLISYSKFSDIPDVSLKERVLTKERIAKGDFEAAKRARDASIRYIIDPRINISGLNNESAQIAILRAIASWQRFIPVFSEAKSAGEANLVITTGTFGTTVADGVLALSDIGPPVGHQLRLSINSAVSWNPSEFEGVVCHELGHSLGIRHSDITRPRQLMGVVRNGVSTPQDQDIELAKQIWDLRSEPRSFVIDPFSNVGLKMAKSEAMMFFANNRPTTAPVLSSASYFLDRFYKSYHVTGGNFSLAGTKRELLACNAVAKAMFEFSNALPSSPLPPETILVSWLSREQELIAQLTAKDEFDDSILTDNERQAWEQFLKEWREDVMKTAAPQRFKDALLQCAYEITKAGLGIQTEQEAAARAPKK